MHDTVHIRGASRPWHWQHPLGITHSLPAASRCALALSFCSCSIVVPIDASCEWEAMVLEDVPEHDNGGSFHSAQLMVFILHNEYRPAQTISKFPLMVKSHHVIPQSQATL